MTDFVDANMTPDTASTKKVGTSSLLFRAARSLGFEPSWVLRRRLFVVEVDGNKQYINSARCPLNSDVSTSLTRNKHLTRRVLEHGGLQNNIPYIVTRKEDGPATFLEEHGKIVAKPVSGSGARDIHIVTDKSQLEYLSARDYIFEKFIAGDEMRYLVLEGEVIAVHRSDYGDSVEHDRVLERISYEKDDWDPALVVESLEIATILGLRFAAIDFIVDRQGDAHILEVNSAPGLKWFHAPTHGPVVDVAKRFMTAVCEGERP